MKKLNFFFVLMISLLTYQSYLGQNVVLTPCSNGIGSNSYGPMNSIATANAKSRDANIIPASQLTALNASTITSVFFNRFSTTGTLPAGSNFKVYLKLTAAADFGAAALDWATEIATATLVYDGDPAASVGSTAGYKQFVLNSGFAYTAGSNLAIYMEYSQTTAPATTINWDYEYGTTCTTTNNNTGKHATSTTTLPATLGTSNYRRPVLAFNATFAPAVTAPACTVLSSPANNSVGIPANTTFTWAPVPGQNGASSYLINLGTTPGGTDVLNGVDVGNVTTYTLTTPLNYSQAYYVTIIPKNAIGNATGCVETKFTTSVPPPANDDCAAAVTLTVNPDLLCGAVTAGNTLGATLSMAATPCFGNPDDDVWFKFVATGSSHQIKILNTVATGTSTSVDMYFQVLDGTCGTMTSVLCSDPNTNTVSGLTAGSTYYVRVYTYSGSGANVSFDICVGAFPPPPANDDCATAISLTVNADINCAVKTAGTTLSATTSPDALTPCTGVADDDVWYSFVATATSHLISLTDVVAVGTGTSTALNLQILSGTCGTLTSVACDTTFASPLTVTGLTVGQTYYARVYNSATGSTVAANSFNICVGTFPPPPANDECGAAIALTVNTGLTCTVKTAGTTLSATASTDVLTPCTGVADDDVWYSFVATSTGHIITLSDVVALGSGTSTALNLQILTGACGSLTSVACDTSFASPLTLTTLVVGQTYYARVYNSATGNTANANSFSICVATLPPPPTNDDCGTAQALTVNADLNCGVKTAGYTYAATASTDVLTPCTGNADDDVWYSFVATGPSHTVSLTNVVSIGTTVTTSLYLQILSGTCGSLTSVLCDTSAASPAVLTGLTPGATYYARVYTFGAGSTANANSFDICVGSPPPPPVNDGCAGAVAVTPGATFAQNAVTATNVNATTDGTATCQGNSANNVWFTVVVPANGNITLETDAAATNTLTDTVIQAYSGSCGTLTSLDCNDDDGNGNHSKLVLTGLAPGSTIYVSVWVWSSASLQNGNFQFSAYDGSLATTNIVKQEKGVNIYPNPFTDFIRISEVKDVVSVSVIDMSGRVVKTVKPANEINLASLKSGMYLIHLKMKDGSVKTVKSIKK